MTTQRPGSSKKEFIVRTVVFILFLALNLWFILIHEPWRDEIHAWLMAKYMSPVEMIEFSSYEGHPLLWHFMLMPFAKLGAPVWTMHVISYITVAASAYLMLFKTKMNYIVQSVIVLCVPFVFIYSSVARNYCLILLLTMIIAVMYDDRYKHPFLYSIPIALMVFTHGCAWGLVAGLTVTFHILELCRVITGKARKADSKVIQTTAGLAVIAISSITAVLTIYSSRSVGYFSGGDGKTDITILSMVLIMVMAIVITILLKGKIWRETVVLVMAYSFMIVIYKISYSSVILQRLLLIQVFLLLFVICIRQDDNKKINVAALAVYFLSFLVSGAVFDTFEAVRWDVTGHYSSAEEMADYINRNLPDEDMILVDAGIYAQTMVPYTDKKLYDINYKEYITDSLYCMDDTDAIYAAIFDIPKHPEYKGRYLVLRYRIENSPFDEIYRTSDSYTGEEFTLFFIK